MYVGDVCVHVARGIRHQAGDSREITGRSRGTAAMKKTRSASRSPAKYRRRRPINKSMVMSN